MKKLSIIILGLACLNLVACVSEPHTTASVVDNRPQISFKAQGKSTKDRANHPRNYHVYIDNLYMGTADNYIASKRALRVLSGSHIVKVEKNGSVVLTQKIYVGDGVSKTILIP